MPDSIADPHHVWKWVGLAGTFLVNVGTLGVGGTLLMGGIGAAVGYGVTGDLTGAMSGAEWGMNVGGLAGSIALAAAKGGTAAGRLAAGAGQGLKGAGYGGVRSANPSVLARTASGRLGGELYGEAQLAKLEGYLARRNVTLVQNADEFLNSQNAGAAFRSFADGAGKFYVRSNATAYDVWHEMVHFRDFRMRVVKLGPEAGYNAYAGWGQAAREQSVYEVLNGGRHWDMLNAQEQAHAIWQVKKYGITP